MTAIVTATRAVRTLAEIVFEPGAQQTASMR
jgi:hypothetical protein